MKNRILTAVILIIYGLFISIGPQKWFKVCSSTASMMKCYWTSRAEIGVGILFLLIALLVLFSKERITQIIINLFSLATAVLALSFPLILIGGCGNPKMPCRTTAFPVIYILTGILMFYIILNLFYLIKITKKMSGDK